MAPQVVTTLSQVIIVPFSRIATHIPANFAVMMLREGHVKLQHSVSARLTEI